MGYDRFVCEHCSNVGIITKAVYKTIPAINLGEDASIPSGYLQVFTCGCEYGIILKEEAVKEILNIAQMEVKKLIRPRIERQ